MPMELATLQEDEQYCMDFDRGEAMRAYAGETKAVAISTELGIMVISQEHYVYFYRIAGFTWSQSKTRLQYYAVYGPSHHYLSQVTSMRFWQFRKKYEGYMPGPSHHWLIIVSFIQGTVRFVNTARCRTDIAESVVYVARPLAACSMDDTLVVSCEDDAEHVVRVYHTKNINRKQNVYWHLLRTIGLGFSMNISSLKVTRDGRHVVIADARSGRVRLHSLSTGRLAHTLVANMPDVQDVEQCEEGWLVCSTEHVTYLSDDGHVRGTVLKGPFPSECYSQMMYDDERHTLFVTSGPGAGAGAGAGTGTHVHAYVSIHGMSDMRTAWMLAVIRSLALALAL